MVLTIITTDMDMGISSVPSKVKCNGNLVAETFRFPYPLYVEV